MDNSNAAIRKILVHEGGYVDHPNDPGGATNKGITIATFRRYIKPNGTKADLRALTTEQAVVVYKRQYWDAVMGDSLPSGVDYAVADFAVNSGPSRAAKYLQSIVGVAQDGRIGPATLAAVNKADPVKVINQLCDDRLAFMKRLKIWATFKNGWSRRVADVRKVSLSWVDDTPAFKPHVDAPKAPKAQEVPQAGWVAALVAFFASLTRKGGK